MKNIQNIQAGIQGNYWFAGNYFAQKFVSSEEDWS